MIFLRRNWPSILLLIAWFPFVLSLWDIPSEEKAREFGSSMVSLAKQGEKESFFLNENERKELNNGINWLSDPQAIMTKLRIGWASHILVLFIGVASITLAAHRVKGWRTGLVVASMSYLLLAHGFPFLRALNLEQWRAWWMLATEYPQWGIGAAYREIVFPLFHVVLIMAIPISYVLSFRKRFDVTFNHDV